MGLELFPKTSPVATLDYCEGSELRHDQSHARCFTYLQSCSRRAVRGPKSEAAYLVVSARFRFPWYCRRYVF